MAAEHPDGLNESCLVGDGGRSWYREQRRNQQQNDNHNSTLQSELQSNTRMEQSKLLSKQQKKRLKRQKKKQRKQNHKSSTVNTEHIIPPNNNRSDFLYKHKSNKNKEEKFQNSSHPFPKPSQSQAPKQRKTPFKTYQAYNNQEELNKISAQMLKAKLMGNTALHTELQQKLDKMREESFVIEKRYECTMPQRNEQQKEHKSEAINTTIDGNGNINEVEFILDGKINKALAGMEQMNAINDDDDIQTLLKKERNQTAFDQNQSMIKNKKMKQLNAMTTDDQFDSVSNQIFDKQSNEKMNSRKRKREAEKEKYSKNHKRARLISQHKQQTNWLKSCRFCVENTEIHSEQMSHCVIWYGEFVYLAVPKHECLVDYECVIVPNEHLKSFREGIEFNDQIGASKEEQLRFDKELYAIQKVLCKIFKAKGKGMCYIETVRNLKKNYHSMIYCYPIDFEDFNLCPVIFKKSIEESDVMWSTNKRVIDVTKDKPLKKAIPHFMSYFFVKFGMYEGYVHVIEDETKVRQDFGASIIAGICDKVLFKAKNESYSKQLERASLLKELFEPYREKIDQKLKKNKQKNTSQQHDNDKM